MMSREVNRVEEPAPNRTGRLHTYTPWPKIPAQFAIREPCQSKTWFEMEDDFALNFASCFLSVLSCTNIIHTSHDSQRKPRQPTTTTTAKHVKEMRSFTRQHYCAPNIDSLKTHCTLYLQTGNIGDRLLAVGYRRGYRCE